MRIDTSNPTAEQLQSLYDQGMLYNLRNLPKTDHRVYVHPRLVLRHRNAKDYHAHPFILHSAQYAFFSGSDLSPIDTIEQALYCHPSLAFYTLGKLRYRYNDLLASALKTNRVFII